MQRIVAICAFASVATAAIACEKITHFDEFAVGEPPLPDASEGGEQRKADDEICHRCTNAAPGLRHPPCPVASAAPDDGQVYVYAWRRLRLGLDPDPMKSLVPSFYDTRVGYDLDCSARMPNGFPVKCAPIFGDGGPDAQKYPWQPFPEGIDNSLAQRFLGPLYLGAIAFDSTTLPLDVTFSQSLENGHGSILTIVYDWNGTPDDPLVSVRIVSAFGLVGIDTDPNKVPRWDGTDQWIAATDQPDPNEKSDQIPLVNSKTDRAYVSGGVLVVDYSSLKPLYTHIVNGGVALEVPLFDLHLVADITKDNLSYEQFFGRWPLDNFAAKNDDIAAFLAACDPVKLNALKRALPGLSRSAADFLIDDTMPSSTPCDALTVTWAADAVRASIGGYKKFSTAPTACP